ncbi:ATP-binding protein [Paenibacillus sp. J5C_2022]|uniref:sensor histidine kinase n=1 Tax=Paenibacillus sp. J5C2022 TaxID=2977129 RepID=UPI0021D1AA07|nr:ATP-binding protein [Paenibacillus sp. J5C2022]MCU6707264.1 ATP-binding protein [Paenibacillus sp. J5C2022]
MKRSLTFRISALLIAFIGAVLVIASIAIIQLTHYHFQMYGRETGGHHASELLYAHLEQAIMQSIGLTIGGALLVSIILSVYIAKKISSPLVRMKNIALVMARGKHHVRMPLIGVPKGEIDELAASINHLAEQLQQQERLRVSMSENIAHELRTPLTTLNSQFAAIQDGVWEPTAERIASSREEIDRLIGLVQQLEELHRHSSSETVLMRKELLLSESISPIVHFLQPSFSEKGVTLEEGDIPAITIVADENRLAQVWTNLLHNALKFTPAGGKVTIEGSLQGHDVRITVSDNGIGIPSEDLPHIFERFYRVDKSRNRKKGGGGLGLAITKSIVENHDGQVWAESGNVTQLHVLLPINREGAPD